MVEKSDTEECLMHMNMVMSLMSMMDTCMNMMEDM